MDGTEKRIWHQTSFSCGWAGYTWGTASPATGTDVLRLQAFQQADPGKSYTWLCSRSAQVHSLYKEAFPSQRWLVWLFFFSPLLIYSWNLGTGSKTCLTLKGHGAQLWRSLKDFNQQTISSCCPQQDSRVHCKSSSWCLRILQQQMAVERGARFLLTGPSLEPCSPWTLDINRRKRNILL